MLWISLFVYGYMLSMAVCYRETALRFLLIQLLICISLSFAMSAPVCTSKNVPKRLLVHILVLSNYVIQWYGVQSCETKKPHG